LDDVRKFCEELSWRQSIDTLTIIERMQIWAKSLASDIESSRDKMKELLDLKRKEWMELTGGKTFPGWGIAELDRKIDEFKERQQEIDSRKELEEVGINVIVKKSRFNNFKKRNVGHKPN
jgi:hypothetical protein